MLRVALQRAWRPTAGALAGYDKRWGDRDSAWFKQFESSARSWEAAYEATASSPAPIDETSDALSALEVVLRLDQIPRTLYPKTRRAYARDDLAVGAARDAVRLGKDLELEPDLRVWMYMPFLHSERLDDQETCVRKMDEVARAHPPAAPFTRRPSRTTGPVLRAAGRAGVAERGRGVAPAPGGREVERREPELVGDADVGAVLEEHVDDARRAAAAA
ncbi:DUF924-containing protein [Aureococcus anophagefferens]|nr:DUF924-containing protein [Aureococcus anophagefferens]